MSAPTSSESEPITPVWVPVLGALLFAALLVWWFAPGRQAADATVRVDATGDDAAEARPREGAPDHEGDDHAGHDHAMKMKKKAGEAALPIAPPPAIRPPRAVPAPE